MLKYLATRRLNIIDVIAIAVSSPLLSDGRFLVGGIVWLVGMCVSVWAEARLKARVK